MLSVQENPKSKLQEKCQANHVTPEYFIVNESGPSHDKMFIAEVRLENKVLAVGEGRSKKEAEANAAISALDNYSYENGDK